MQRHRRVIYWSCQALGWSAYFVICTIASQSYAPLTARTIKFYLCLSFAGVLMTHAFRLVVRKRQWLQRPLRALLVRVLPANFVMALLLVATGFAISSMLGPLRLHRETTTSMLAGAVYFVVNDFMVLMLWSVGYFGFRLLEREQRAERDRYETRTAIAEAELHGLKRQLNPHFLFNALNSLRALVVEDPPRARAAVTQLAGILRYHLASGERWLVSLEEELATVEQYLALELMRFDDRMTVATQIEREAKACVVPPLAVQTLVENAIKYGVSREPSAGRITIDAQVQRQDLVIVVGNTGTLSRHGHGNSTGLGLTNLRTRLRLLFGDAASIALRETTPRWVEARLVLPARL